MATYERHEIGARPQPGSAVGTIVFLLFGPIVWAGHFAFCYGMQSVACTLASVGQGGSIPVRIDGLIWLATLAAAGLIVAALLARRALASLLRADVWSASQSAFQRRTMSWLATLSLFAVIALAVGTLLIDSCALLR